MSYLVIGLEGPELTDAERGWLRREEVGGVILFARNFSGPAQLRALVAEVRALAEGALVMVDQEGGRVQRIGAPATVLPPLRALGRRYAQDPGAARALADAHARLMAGEMRALDIDLSLAPVLDLDGVSEVIGDRAFHREPAVVADLGQAYVRGMHAAGMAACGKHFPGHGSVLEDTHHADARDGRTLGAIAAADLLPFRAAQSAGIEALMISHVVYPAVDPRPAGYSRGWIEDQLRGELAFTGVVLSDDLGMAAACGVGAFPERVRAALGAGNDLLLVCRPADVAECLGARGPWPAPRDDVRARLRGGPAPAWPAWAESEDRRSLRERLAGLTGE